VSLVSLWEITIKIAKGGLPELGSSVQYLLDEVREQRFELLPLRPEHLFALGRIDRHHRDPFDRMIIAQGSTERLPVVTNDPSFKKYPVEVFW
jgi:PIN domain nuclease of toxin-antitoxin system